MCTAGIDEADGHEGLAALVGLVLQVLHVHAGVRGNHDVLFPHQSQRRPPDHHVHGPERHVRVPAALRTRRHDLLLRHLHLLLERSVIPTCR